MELAWPGNLTVYGKVWALWNRLYPEWNKDRPHPWSRPRRKALRDCLGRRDW